ncbi:MAG: hypothetical protein AAGD06_04030 [Acidobacteriota bacterium]
MAKESTISFSQEVDDFVRLSSVELFENAHRKRSNPMLPALLPASLFRMYSMVRASVPMMKAARDKAIELGDFPPLVPFLDRLIREEEGHDQFVLDGLTALGFDEETILSTQPPPTIAELVGSQYYWIEYFHPLAIVGYIKVVELDPADECDIVDLVEHVLHIQENCLDDLPGELGVGDADMHQVLDYFKKHVNLEKAHNDHLDDFLDDNEFNQDQKSLIMTSAARTNFMLARSLDEICRLFDTGGARGLF